MTESIEILLSQAIHDQLTSLAKQLNISQAALLQTAVQQFINFHAMPDETKRIHQGDVYWIQPEGLDDLGSHPHPYVVIQADVLNHSRIHTVVVCALTTNLKQANAPGNVLLEGGEANLPQQSAVVVSKISAVPKAQLGDYIGTLNEARIHQIMAGLKFLQSSYYR